MAPATKEARAKSRTITEKDLNKMSDLKKPGGGKFKTMMKTLRSVGAPSILLVLVAEIFRHPYLSTSSQLESVEYFADAGGARLSPSRSKTAP